MTEKYCHADSETWDQFFARLDRLKEMESENAALRADTERYVKIASDLESRVLTDDQLQKLGEQWHDTETIGDEQCNYRQLEVTAFIAGYRAALEGKTP